MLGTINWFAEIPATLSKTRYCNITTNYNRVTHSHPSYPSICIVAKQNRVKLVCNPPKLIYVIWIEYEFEIGGWLPAKTFSKEGRGMDW